MSKHTQADDTVNPFQQITVTDDYGIQVTGNPDWKQMRGDGSAECITPTARPAIALA